MTKTFFIADVHLGSDYPEKTSLLLSFMDLVQREGGDLYILGDLFDYWANNKKILNDNAPVLTGLQALASCGSRVGLLYGNRDFLISEKSLAPYGIDFLGEEKEIILDKKRVFLAHGHTLCLGDIQFLRYKERVWPLFRRLDRVLPGFIENFLAKKFILKSKEVIESQEQSRFQFTMDLVRDYFSDGIDTVICGHGHRKEEHHLKQHSFYALPAWENARGHYLLHAGGDFGYHEFAG